MKTLLRPYYPPYHLLSRLSTGCLLLLTLGLLSCNGKQKKLDRRISLWRKDKLPYGTYVAYENLEHLFPNATVSTRNTSPVGLLNEDGKKAYIIITSFIDPDESETNAIINLAASGNHVFISAPQMGDSLLHALRIRLGNRYYVETTDSPRLTIDNPVTHDSLSYTYPGTSIHNWVDSMDEKITTVTGHDTRGRPDMIRFTYHGGGSITLQFDPLAFSNFFLLHKQNMSYYNNALSYIPASVDQVIWDDYFRYARERQQNNFSALRYILNNKSLRWALWLLLLLFLLIYLFESKRRQRQVPVITALRNNSLDFIKTIGRLYYQRRDNHNLVIKMITHFQDQVRTRYNIQTPLADPGFVERLAWKTGLHARSLNEMTGDMLRLQDSPTVRDEDLLALNKQLEEFYKQIK